MKRCCGVTALTGDIDVWCWPQDSRGIEIAVSDLDGKGARYEHYSGARGVIEYALMQARIAGSPVPEVRYNHVALPNVWKADVEIHHRPAFLCSPVRNNRLKRWVQENVQFGLCDAVVGVKTKTIKTPEGSVSAAVSENSSELDLSASAPSTDSVAAPIKPSGNKQEFFDRLRNQKPSGVIPIPTNSFNAVYQLVHIYTHLFDEGIGLRQLLDYYFVLRSLHIEQGSLADRTESMAQWAEGMGIGVKSNAELMHTIGRLGMSKFASATMYVIAKVFANDNTSTDSAQAHNDKLCLKDWQTRWPWMICEPNEKEGKFLLNEIMMAGNFGRYDERIKKTSSQGGHAWEKLKHNMRLVRHYPEEVIWEPFFRIFHYLWRKFELWRF